MKQYFIRHGYVSEEDDLRQVARQAARETTAPPDMAPVAEPPAPTVIAKTAHAPRAQALPANAEPGAVLQGYPPDSSDATDLEAQLLAIQQIMSTVRARDVAVSGTIRLQLNVEISL